MNCPLCIDQTLEVTWRNGIELDICPKCRGIWLDRGEIDRLLADDDPPPPSAAGRVEPPRREPPRREVDDDDWDDLARRASSDRKKKSKKKPKRRKSLAERLGDAIEDVIDEIT